MRHNILFFSYWYPNVLNRSSGIFVKRHAHAVALNNNLVVLSLIIGRGRGLYEKDFSVSHDEKGVETHQLVIRSRFYKALYLMLPFQYRLLKNYIAGALKHQKFDVVHSNVIFPCAIVGARLARQLDCKHIITEHWTKIDKFFARSFYAGMGIKALNKATAITAVSEQLASTLKKYTRHKRLFIVPNVIDADEFFYDPGIQKNETFTFIAAANWSQHKNPFYFLDALQMICEKKSIGTFKVTMAGEGEQLEKVKAKHYPFDIEFAGNLTAPALNRELNKSHIFLHGSDFETFSVIIAEALMCGVPSVTSPVGIAPEVIDDSNGFVTNNTISDWAEKIIKCYHTTYDRAMIAARLKGRYDLLQVGKEFQEVYSKVLQEPN